VSVSRIFAGFLIALGSTQEAYYYWFSFIKEGAANWVALVASAGLVLFLNATVFLTKWSKKWYALAAVIGLFSVISTSVGQDFAVLSVAGTETATRLEAEQAERRVVSLTEDIARLDAEYERMDAEIAATVATLEDRFAWKNTAGGVETMKSLNRAERASKEARLVEAEAQLVAASGAVTYGVYDHYAKILRNLVRPETIQFFKHLWLSVLLMMMAPTGIKMWEGGEHGRSGDLFAPRPRLPTPAIPGAGKVAKKRIKRHGKMGAIDLAAWATIPDPAPLRAAAACCGLSHTVLYRAINAGELQGWGTHPIRAYKKDIEKWMASRAPGGEE
jgi:tellurite resistance protein